MKTLFRGALAALALLCASNAMAGSVKPEVNYSGHLEPMRSTDATAPASGGTGVLTLTAHCVLVGQGTSPVHLVCPTSSGFVLTDNGASSDPSFQAVSAGTVTTSGSPASGNLAKFCGSTCITNGDLSGDVSTSGTLVTTIGAHKVVLGDLAQSTANTMLGNWTGSTADVAANAMPSCPDSAGNHLNYVSGTGITCGTGAIAASPITSSSSQCFAVGPNGNTNPSFNVDCSTASAVTGLNVKSFAAGGGVGAGVALSATSTATDEIMRIDAKGAATLYLQHTGTGAVEVDHNLIVNNLATANSPVCNDGSKILVTGCSGMNASFTNLDIINNSGAYKIGGTIVMRPGGISIASGFCTSPSITNGETAAFAVTLGTSCSGVQSGVITIQAATTKWACHAQDATSPDSYELAAYSTSTTSVTIKNYNKLTGAPADFVASESLQVMCLGY